MAVGLANSPPASVIYCYLCYALKADLILMVRTPHAMAIRIIGTARRSTTVRRSGGRSSHVTPAQIADRPRERAPGACRPRLVLPSCGFRSGGGVAHRRST